MEQSERDAERAEENQKMTEEKYRLYQVSIIIVVDHHALIGYFTTVCLC